MIGLGPTPAPAALTRWALRPESTREGLTARYVLGDGSSVSALDPQLDAFAIEDCVTAESELLVRMPFKPQTRRRLFQLFWTPPGGDKQLISPTHFVPQPDGSAQP